jgi:hypothetical protein
VDQPEVLLEAEGLEHQHQVDQSEVLQKERLEWVEHHHQVARDLQCHHQQGVALGLHLQQQVVLEEGLGKHVVVQDRGARLISFYCDLLQALSGGAGRSIPVFSASLLMRTML